MSELVKNGNKIDIVGLPGDGSGALVINVDCEGSSVTLPDQINLYIGGSAATFGEVDRDTGYVLWNFYNCDEANITATAMVGSILAPGANLTLEGNACGTFIADSITVKGETHTRPFHGKFKPSDDTTSVDVEKAWLDSKGAPETSVSHDAVSVQLYYADEDGNATEPVLDSKGQRLVAQLSDANNWKASFGGLPKKQDGVALRYTVVEIDAPADYDSTVTGGSNSFVITNQHKAQVEISASKDWRDSDDADGLRPDSIEASVVRVAKDGSEQVVGTLSLSKANGWKGSVSGLPAADGEGNEYSYSLKEVDVEGYDSVISLASNPTKDEFGNISYEFSLVNTHKTKTIDVKVKKEWNDGSGTADNRPDSVTARLCVLSDDGQKIPVEGVEDKELNDENGWTASWSGLPANKAGEQINYTVDEVDVPEGYELTDVSGVQEDGGYAFTMTNTASQEEDAFALTGYSVRSISGPDLQPEKVCYVDPKITKALTGRQLQEGEFKFQLISEKTGEVVSTATNEKSGMVDFDKGENNKNPDGMEACCLKFTEAGTYVYVVKEVSEQKDPTIQYSDEVVKFVVNVSEIDGALVSDGGTYFHYDSADDAVATYSIAGDSGEHPTITNSVKPVVLGLSKANAQGVGLQDATYGLYRNGTEGEGNAVLVAQATSDANGHMAFVAEPGGEPISEGVEYWFQEISAPDGYALSLDQSVHFKLLRSGEGSNTAYYLEYANGDKSDTYPVGEIVEFEDGIPVTDQELFVVLNKVDSSRNAVSGARLGVREANSDEAIAEWDSGDVGYVLRGVRANVAYVLYERAVPDGYAKAGDVTFMLDAYGNVSIVEGNSAAVNGQDVVNAFGAGNALTMIDYKQGELVKRVAASSEERKFAKTGDGVHAEAVAVLAAGALCATLIARRFRRSE